MSSKSPSSGRSQKLSAEDEALVQQLSYWADNPVDFVLENFAPGYDAQHPEPLILDGWQELGLRYLVRHEPHGNCDGSPARRLAFKACKGPGKTAELSWIGWWRMAINAIHRGAAVSITGDNLYSGLWPEFGLWRSYSPYLTDTFEVQGKNLQRKGSGNWWIQARTFAKDADKTQQAVTMAGLHAPAVTVLLDEVGSYPKGVIDAAKGIFNTKGQDVLLVVAGNATDVDGALHSICTEDADEFHIIEITGDPDDPHHSNRVDIEQARKDIAKYGRQDAMVMVNWLGKFPPKGGNKLLSADEVSDAMKRNCPRHIWERQPMVWGLDVAGEGIDPDAAKLYKRRGPVAFLPRTWRNTKTIKLAEQVILEFVEAKKQGKAPKKIFVDKGGIGRGCYEVLAEKLNGPGREIVEGVDFGEAAIEDDTYDLRRTEMWFNLAIWTRSVGCLPNIGELRRDLTAPNTGTESRTSKGTRRTLESKDSMRKRGLPSPDDGDGLALTFASPVLPDDPDEDLAAAAAAAREQHQAKDFDPYAHLGGRR